MIGWFVVLLVAFAISEGVFRFPPLEQLALVEASVTLLHRTDSEGEVRGQGIRSTLYQCLAEPTPLRTSLRSGKLPALLDRRRLLLRDARN